MFRTAHQSPENGDGHHRGGGIYPRSFGGPILPSHYGKARHPYIRVLSYLLVVCAACTLLVPLAFFLRHHSYDPNRRHNLLTNQQATTVNGAGHTPLSFHRHPTLSKSCSSRIAQFLPDLYPGQRFSIEAKDDLPLFNDRLKKLDVLPAIHRYNTYRTMAAALKASSLQLGGEVTQGLKQSALFSFDDSESESKGKPRTILQALDHPVRAVVAPLRDAAISERLVNAVRAALRSLPGAPVSFYEQDPNMLHSTIFHTSSFEEPWSPKSEEDRLKERLAIEQALSAVPSVDYQSDLFTLALNWRDQGGSAGLKKGCPIQVALERIVVTPGGVLIACWQIFEGAEVAEIRSYLGRTFGSIKGLKHVKQVITNPDILHTTLGRFLLPPRGQGKVRAITEAEASNLGSALTETLCGTTAELSELWLVREDDLLALGLQGKYSVEKKFPLQCR